jgi:hexosaminidase
MWGGKKTFLSYKDFALQSKNIGEGPSLNMRGKIGQPNTLVADFHFDEKEKGIRTVNASYGRGIKGNALTFTGNGSYATLPYDEIGYDYTISFWVNPSADNKKNVPIFSSENSVVKLKQGNTHYLGFSRDGYNFNFNYEVPTNTWTHIVITGTNKGTSLYVNGKLQDKLYDRWIQFNNERKSKVRKVETLFFPLKSVGGFSGKIDELKVWNKVLSDQQIKDL